MLRFEIIPVTHYQQNCSLLWCDETQEAALVDPGGDIEKLLATVAERDLKLAKIFLTHGHLDHVGATAALVARLQLPVIGPHRDDMFWLNMLPQQAQMMGFTPVGVYRNVGSKNGLWHDVGWWQRPLRPPASSPGPPLDVEAVQEGPSYQRALAAGLGLIRQDA